MIPEAELEQQVIRQVQAVKVAHPHWQDPNHLAQQLGIRVEIGRLGSYVEGATLDDVIVLQPTTGVRSRYVFTYYHEIAHQLIRRNDELYSILHDQYDRAADLTRIVERLANVGAAEFLVPRATVVATSKSQGYTLELLKQLQVPDRVSPTAVCVQLGLCAPHRCITVVARGHDAPVNRAQSHLFVPQQARLVVEVATSSRSMKYVVAKGTAITSDHLVHQALDAEPGCIITGKAWIPFRNAAGAWEVDCEAVRVGSQVFALFHADPAPLSSSNQLYFEF